MLDYLRQTSVILALIIGYVLPLVTAFIARSHWSVSVLGPITVVLAAATGFLTEWAAAPDNFRLGDGFLRMLLVVLAALVGHYQSWKDTPVQAKLLAT